MSDTRYDVIAIGNAIVDVLAQADDVFLDDHGLTKGTMSLIEEQTAESIYEKMGPGIECSGGSAANTIAVLASLGGKCAFIGKVKDVGNNLGLNPKALRATLEDLEEDLEDDTDMPEVKLVEFKAGDDVDDQMVDDIDVDDIDSSLIAAILEGKDVDPSL